MYTHVHCNSLYNTQRFSIHMPDFRVKLFTTHDLDLINSTINRSSAERYTGQNLNSMFFQKISI